MNNSATSLAPAAAGGPANASSRFSYAMIDMDASVLKCDPHPLPAWFGTEIPLEPMVTLYRNETLLNTYDLFITAYIPKGAEAVILDTDVSEVRIMNTEAGEMIPRVINIRYANPPAGTAPEYEQYNYFIRYTVEETLAPAICVQYIIGDPRTSRGTVTVVRLT